MLFRSLKRSSIRVILKRSWCSSKYKGSPTFNYSLVLLRTLPIRPEAALASRIGWKRLYRLQVVLGRLERGQQDRSVLRLLHHESSFDTSSAQPVKCFYHLKGGFCTLEHQASSCTRCGSCEKVASCFLCGCPDCLFKVSRVRGSQP